VASLHKGISEDLLLLSILAGAKFVPMESSLSQGHYIMIFWKKEQLNIIYSNDLALCDQLYQPFALLMLMKSTVFGIKRLEASYRKFSL
jgi:hypothetical protein